VLVGREMPWREGEGQWRGGSEKPWRLRGGELRKLSWGMEGGDRDGFLCCAERDRADSYIFVSRRTQRLFYCSTTLYLTPIFLNAVTLSHKRAGSRPACISVRGFSTVNMHCNQAPSIPPKFYREVGRGFGKCRPWGALRHFSN
jgi:hypothetical protein